ncbi:hypothetical protein RYX36_027015 [Vicia faba]
MGRENGSSVHKRTSNGALPTTYSNDKNRRNRSKTFNNVKITILCGFVTILVLRGTIGVNFGSSDSDAVNQSVIEETNRILSEIRSAANPMLLSDSPTNQPQSHPLSPSYNHCTARSKQQPTPASPSVRMASILFFRFF